MRHALPALLLAFTSAAFSSTVAADPGTFVAFRVAGHFQAHVRVTASATAPCSASHERPLIDAWVSSGATLRAPLSSCLCYEHTRRGSASVWTEAKVICPAPSSQASSSREPRVTDVTLDTGS